MFAHNPPHMLLSNVVAVLLSSFDAAKHDSLTSTLA